MNFKTIKKQIENCNNCKELFGFHPTPIFWGNENSKIVQISQAPSKAVNESKKPFTDMSGKTLKQEWYKITDEEFYNKDNFYIGALGHCYPGKDKRGNDKQPPKICFEKWVKEEIKYINNQLFIIIGAKASQKFFPNEKFEELVFKNNKINNKTAIVLPHPSPLNRKWIKDHPDFVSKRLDEIRNIIYKIIRE